MGARQVADQLANALHLLPYRSTAHDAVGVKLDPHRLGVEGSEIDLNFSKYLPFSGTGPKRYDSLRPRETWSSITTMAMTSRR
jgi:hypothetical protein